METGYRYSTGAPQPSLWAVYRRVGRRQFRTESPPGSLCSGHPLVAGSSLFASGSGLRVAHPSLDPNGPNRYGLTFHVGEDFRHLLSGLRAVDEALRFLNMGPGDRIGHGLALGLNYKIWCERVGGEVAMPRGERLDDLVWLRQRLGKEPGVLAVCSLPSMTKSAACRGSCTAIDQDVGSGFVDWQQDKDWELLQLALVDWQHQYTAWTYRYRDPLSLWQSGKVTCHGT